MMLTLFLDASSDPSLDGPSARGRPNVKHSPLQRNDLGPAEDYYQKMLQCCMIMPVHNLKALCQQNLQVSKYPLYSPDAAPSDCHLFGVFKDTLKGHFTCDQEVKDVVHSCLVTQSKHFFFRECRSLKYILIVSILFNKELTAITF
jgi:hypothetical protein